MSSACDGSDVCVTCSDYAVPAEVLGLEDNDMALVRAGEAVERISVALVDVQVGGVVLVHAGEAIGVLPDARAKDGTDV